MRLNGHSERGRRLVGDENFRVASVAMAIMNRGYAAELVR